MILRIASDFTKTPGGRYISNGPFSGEAFREQLLLPMYKFTCSCGAKLTIDFDGGYGYAISFIEEAFGGLVRRIGKADILAHLRFISEEEPELIAEVTGCIRAAARNLANKIPPRTFATPPPPPELSTTISAPASCISIRTALCAS